MNEFRDSGSDTSSERPLPQTVAEATKKLLKLRQKREDDQLLNDMRGGFLMIGFLVTSTFFYTYTKLDLHYLLPPVIGAGSIVCFWNRNRIGSQPQTEQMINLRTEIQRSNLD